MEELELKSAEKAREVQQLSADKMEQERRLHLIEAEHRSQAENLAAVAAERDGLHALLKEKVQRVL